MARQKKNKNSEKQSFLREASNYIKGKPKSTVIIYLVLRMLVIATMAIQAVHGNYYNVLLCVLTLMLFLIPAFVDRRLNIKLPSLLEIIILLFAFSAEILGEIQNFYGTFKSWDTMLHTMNGFMMAAIGFALIDILNNDPRFHFTASPIFVAFVAFCFSMTVGVLWEFFEFSMDYFLKTDMQKDFIYTTIATVNSSVNPSGENSAVIINDVKTTLSGVVNGIPAEYTYNGYIDIGIKDTMKDLMVNCLGAIVFSILGVFYIKGRSRLAEKFMPTLKTEQDFVQENA